MGERHPPTMKIFASDVYCDVKLNGTTFKVLFILSYSPQNPCSLKSRK